MLISLQNYTQFVCKNFFLNEKNRIKKMEKKTFKNLHSFEFLISTKLKSTNRYDKKDHRIKI